MKKHKHTPEEIIEETQRESILNRPHNLAGSIQSIPQERFNISQDKVEFKISNIVPALLKLFQEALDNPIDVAIKSNFKFANKIDIQVNNKSIQVKDNGYGISSEKDHNGEYPLYKAMCKYNTSSNYREANDGQKGVNGIGIKLCTTLSTLFQAISSDGIKEVQIEAYDNNLNHNIKAKNSVSKGTSIYFEPDFKIFEVNEINQEHIIRMYEYVLIQSLTYPQIEFKFNGKKVNYTPKKFLELFNLKSHLIQEEDFYFAIMPNCMDDFKQISFVNGLETKRGGSHIEYIIQGISYALRDKLVKKYKTIKPADIRHRLQIVLIAKNFKGLKWDGQTKESVTNTEREIKEYFNLDFEKIASQLMKITEIIDPITEVYKLKEELKKRQELKSLDKTVKKIKSDKYIPSIGNKKYLMLIEGESAISGLMPALGRSNIGYYILKGKPLNSYDSDQAKFTQNKELSELYKIVKNEGYEYMIIASDQDLDGIHIRGLLVGFVERYLPEYKNKFGVLNTPVICVKKNNIVQRWYYSLQDEIILKAGEVSKYYKGLGSHNEKDLKSIIETEGLENMIDIFGASLK